MHSKKEIKRKKNYTFMDYDYFLTGRWTLLSIFDMYGIAD